MSKIKKMVFKRQKTQMPNYEECFNYLGFNKIEILEFNYDGKGTALVLEDKRLDTMCTECLDFLIYSGWYSMIEYN
jgi:hypothetical protein